MSDLEIARDDIALSAIAAGNPPDSDDPTLLLLASYRADLDDASAAPSTVSVPLAPVVPIRRRRSATLIALSAAAGIVVGGLTAGAVVFADRPGESLHSVHVALFGEARTRTEEVTALLDQASGMLARGDRAAARRLLGRAATLIPSTPESDQPALRRRLDDLSEYAAEPRPTPRPSASVRTPEPTETPDAPEPSESESEDRSGSNSGSGSSGSGSDGSGGDRVDPDPDPDKVDEVDNSGSGSSNSGSGSSNSGSDR